MIPKITTHAAAVVEQNRKDRIRVLSRGARLKSKRHSPPASFSGSFTNGPAIRLERRSKTAQSNRIQCYVAHFRKHILLLVNWNVLIPTRKGLALVEEAKNYHLDIVGRSSTKRRSSGIVDLDDGWKRFYSGTDPSISARVDVGFLISLQLFDWISLGITDLYTEVQSKKSVIMTIAGVRPLML